MATRRRGAAISSSPSGTHFSDVDTGGWTLFDIPAKARLIHLDIDENELGRAYPAEVALGCDARLGLAALAAATAKTPADRRAWHAEIAGLRRDWEASVEGDRRSEMAPLHYARVCHDAGEVVAAVDPEMPVFFDTGHLLQFGPAFLGVSSRHVAHAGFFHRMGWSASAIIGASLARGALARPGASRRRVVPDGRDRDRDRRGAGPPARVGGPQQPLAPDRAGVHVPAVRS